MTDPKADRDRPSFLLAGLSGRCPRCGKGPLFKGFLSVNDRCAVCDEDLARHSSDDGPAYFVMFFVSTLVIFLALIVEVREGWSIATHLLVWGALSVVLSLVLLRPVKGVMTATQYKTKARDSGEHD